MIKRGFNFGAGPSMLPIEVLLEVQNELLNWHNLHMSILEIGHRTADFESLLDETTHLFREILNIPDNFEVIWMGGSSRQHFAQIPMNFLSNQDRVAHIVSGIWSKMAYDEAKRFASIDVIANNQINLGYELPPIKNQDLSSYSYVYYAPNETVDGFYIHDSYFPNSSPLVADMTSCILMSPIDFSRYACIFAGAQKTIANAGLSVVIIRKDFLDKKSSYTLPTMWDYRAHFDSKSLLATTPVFNCYLANKMLKWINNQGGLVALDNMNRQKGKMLYDAIDASELFESRVPSEWRSHINVCFHLKNKSLEPIFLEKANNQHLYALSGHRLVGGMRASMYNAMSLSGAQALADFILAFDKEYA